MGAKKVLKLTATLLFIAGTGIFCLSGNTEYKGGASDFLIGSARVELTGGKYAVGAKELNTIITARDIPMLDYFTQLQSADFSGSSCYDEISLWAAENPHVSVRYSIPLPDGSTVDNHTESLDLSWLETKDVPAMVQALGKLPNIRSIKLGAVGGDTLELGALKDLSAAAPNAEFDFKVDIMGQQLGTDVESIDLSSLTHAEAADTAAVLSCMTKLKSVELGSQASGSDLEWADIALLKAARPEAKFSYSFKLYGQELNLDTKKLDFRGTELEDGGKVLYSVLPCMNNCTYLDLDSSGVSNESCAELRDLFPEIEVVWRVWFGENYSVRTDTERILASKPTVGGMITDASMLQYCTRVKYLDLGHNDDLADFSFMASMPELEVVIVSMTGISDLSPLKNCSKLDYLELTSCPALSDLSPLEGLSSIKHMNIAGSTNISDISALYTNTGMERLWIGRDLPVPAEQVEEMKKAAPGIKINTTTEDPHGEAWRYTGYDPDIPLYYWVDRYELIREQLGYNYQDYSFYWLDPLCELEAPAEHAGKYGKQVYGL